MSYRANVAAIIRRQEDNRILICERNDYPGSWQFPQGGVKRGEALEEALYRELAEEVNLRPADVSIVCRRGGYRYRFPGGIKKKGYLGQEQTYFLVDLRPDAEDRLTVQTKNPEFRDIRWIEPQDFPLRTLPENKHEVYRRVFQDFFQVEVAFSGSNLYREES